MSLGIHLLLTFAVLAIHGLAVTLAIWYRQRQRPSDAPILSQLDRLQLENDVCDRLSKRLTSDDSWRQQFVNSWSMFPALLRELNHAERSEHRLQRLLPLCTSRISDDDLLSIASTLDKRSESRATEFRATGSKIAAKNVANRPGNLNSNDRIPPWWFFERALCLGLGMVVCLGMLAYPPWLIRHELWIQTLASPDRHIVVESESIGYQWVFSRQLPSEQIQHIATQDLSRFESTRQLTRINYRRLIAQLGVTLLLLGPLYFRQNFDSQPPKARFARPLTTAHSVGA